MSERDERRTGPRGQGDILAELEAEVAHELEEHRPPAGGPAYQVVGALVALAVGVTGAVLAYGYGLGTLRRPGAGLWPFVDLGRDRGAVGAAAGRRPQAPGQRGVHPLQPAGPASASRRSSALGGLLPIIGFEIPSLLLCVRVAAGSSAASPGAAPSSSASATVAAFYLLFLYGLRIPLPHLF